MTKHNASTRRAVEVRGFKWPRRPTGTAMASLLGADRFGQWFGVAGGAPWWDAEGAFAGVFDAPFVKVVPSGAFWTASFRPIDPLVDVDIVLPVQWVEGVLEEIDLELDILRSSEGAVYVRDREELERVHREWPMPEDVLTQAWATCEKLRAMVERGVEPFGSVGRDWLSRFMDELETVRP